MKLRGYLYDRLDPKHQIKLKKFFQHVILYPLIIILFIAFINLSLFLMLLLSYCAFVGYLEEKEQNEKKSMEEENSVRKEEKRRISIAKRREKFRELQASKGLKEYKGRWITEAEFKKIKSVELGLENNFSDYTGHEFEYFIAKLFEKMGYITTVTKGSGDFGIDVIAENKNEKIAIQVKRFNIEKMVTPNIIRETLGAMNRFGATKCMVITTSGFTAAAEEATTNERIILWDKATLHKNVKKYFIDEELKILSKT